MYKFKLKDITVDSATKGIYHAYIGLQTKEETWIKSKGEPLWVQATGKSVSDARKELLQFLIEDFKELLKENGQTSE